MKVKGILFDMVSWPRARGWRMRRCWLGFYFPASGFEAHNRQSDDRPSRPNSITISSPPQDGTLTDSDSLHYECYRDTLLRFAPEYNGTPPPILAFRSVG